MDLLEIFKMAITSLLSNKTRAALTMLGIIIGVTSIILLISIGLGLTTYIGKQLSDLGASSLFVMAGKIDMSQSGGMSGAGMMSPKFTFEQLNQLKRASGSIKEAMAYSENSATAKYKGRTRIVQITGTGPEYTTIRNHRATKGEYFNNADYTSNKKVAAIGKTVEEKLFKGEDPIGKKITISQQPYTVVAVMEEKGGIGGADQDNLIFIPATTAMRQFDMQYIQSFWLEATSTEDIPQAKKSARQILERSLDKDDFSIVDTKNILDVVSSILGMLTLALSGIAAISLLVGGIGIMNIMLVSVTERTREIGLRKAVGAKPRDVLIQFLIEATVLSGLGGTVGILLGIGGALIINQFFTTTITLWAIALAFLFSTLVGVTFGITPAIRASRLNPITALRYE